MVGATRHWGGIVPSTASLGIGDARLWHSAHTTRLGIRMWTSDDGPACDRGDGGDSA